jgi:hypothetical protein
MTTNHRTKPPARTYSVTKLSAGANVKPAQREAAARGDERYLEDAERLQREQRAAVLARLHGGGS